jgi:hypothetical protein
MWAEKGFSGTRLRIQPKPLAAGLSMDAGEAKRDNDMTALNKSRR